jgi:predicted O-methyltransferase YrrM
MLEDAANRLFGHVPYHGFTPIISEPIWQNWNSTHPALTRLVRELKPAVIMDVGVWTGMSTATLAKAQAEAAPNGITIAIDTFLGSPEHWTPNRPVNNSLRFLFGQPRIYDIFLSNMVLAGHADRVLPICQTSENAAVILRREKIIPDLVHVDAAHEYESCLRDIKTYYDFLRPGGVLLGDDFSWPGVARAVVHFSDERKIPFEVDFPKWIMRKPIVKAA